MVVDFGCMRILVYERFMVDKDFFIGDEIIVLIVLGECFIVFLVWV